MNGYKREDGTVELVPGGYRDTAERVAALVAERTAANAHDPEYTLTVSAPTNMDAHRLSEKIREARREMGQVGPDTVTVQAADRDGNEYDMALAAGDKVRLFASTRAEGERGSIGRNGSILTVKAATKRGMRVVNAKGREGFITWKTLTTDGRVRLAYGEVATTHTAQGSTATEHIYTMPAGTKAVTGFSAYSSGTRHRQKSFMVISDGAERAEVSQRRPLNDTRIITEEDVWANAARNLSRQPVKATALDFLEKASGIERGAARSIQRGLQPMELRQRQGLIRSTLHAIFQRGREAAQVQAVAVRLEQAAEALEPVTARLAALGERVGAAVEQGIAEMGNLLADECGTMPRETSVQSSAKLRNALQKVVVRIPKQHIDDLKRSVSLTHLIGQSVKLDSHGKALCPFHEEKTPSFHVNERKGTFNCYGCGEHGDAMDWLQRRPGPVVQGCRGLSRRPHRDRTAAAADRPARREGTELGAGASGTGRRAGAAERWRLDGRGVQSEGRRDGKGPGAEAVPARARRRISRHRQPADGLRASRRDAGRWQVHAAGDLGRARRCEGRRSAQGRAGGA